MDRNRVVDDRTIIGAPWALEHEGKRVAGDIDKRLRHLIHETKMKEYWRKKFEINEEQQETISWKTFIETNEMNEEWIQIWMVKYNSRIGGV